MKEISASFFNFHIKTIRMPQKLLAVFALSISAATYFFSFQSPSRQYEGLGCSASFCCKRLARPRQGREDQITDLLMGTAWFWVQAGIRMSGQLASHKENLHIRNDQNKWARWCRRNHSRHHLEHHNSQFRLDRSYCCALEIL